MQRAHLSVSQVKTYLLCPLKYFYRYVKRLGHVAKGIQSALFYPNPNFTCPSCPFHKQCDAWQEV